MPFSATFNGHDFTCYFAYVSLDRPVDYTQQALIRCSKEIKEAVYLRLRGKMCVTSLHVYDDAYADPTVSDYSSQTYHNGNLHLRVNTGSVAVNVDLMYGSGANEKPIAYFHTTQGATSRGIYTTMHVIPIDIDTGNILCGSANPPITATSVAGYASSDRPNPFNLVTGLEWPQAPVEYFAPETFGEGQAVLLPSLRINYNDITSYNEYVEPDPYDPGGGSGEGGGEGTFDDTTVPVDIPPLPTLSAVQTGFITLFNPSLSELLALASYMWSTGFDLDTLKKLFADPMDCILGLSIVPVAVPDGGQSAVTVGNISTGVMMNKAASQYVTVDCGSLQVEEYWGGYLDYAPFTQAEIYLPYIGAHPLALDDIMGKTVHVVYHVDILSGACCAYIQCDGTVLYSFIGQCSSSIPVTGNDFTNVINGVLSIAGSIGTMVATGGASSPSKVGTIASNAVNSLKPQVEKSGAMSGTGGLLGIQVPYIILTRPRQALPAGQNALMGYPAFMTRTLGSLSGYTEVESIHLEGIPCTSEELTEIETLLGQGVIL